MEGHFSHNIVEALNDAVVKVFWTKKDMRRMLTISGVNQQLISTQDWDAYKYHIVSPIIDRLNEGENGLGPPETDFARDAFVQSLQSPTPLQ